MILINGVLPSPVVTIVAEANKAFELNSGLFASLRAPSTPPSKSSTPPPSTETFLGDPTSPTVEKSHFEKAREEPIQLLQTGPQGGLKEPTFTMAGVLSFLCALGIAHLALTIGGFTGAAGWEKLEAVEEWIAGLLGH